MLKIISNSFKSSYKGNSIYTISKHIQIKLFSATLFAFAFGCCATHTTNSLFKNSSASWSGARTIMKAGETHTDSIYLNAGNVVHIKIEQYDIDIIAKLSSADGKLTEQFDSPTGELGAEDIYLLSDSGMKYKIEIYPAQKYADPGEYKISVVRKSKATEYDKQWFAALASTQKADKLRTRAETRSQSIQQYESAIEDWKTLNDTLQYARAMRSMDFVYIRQKDFEKAVQVFSGLFPLWKQLGDTRAEGFTYLIIGRVYDLQKDYKKSLDYNLNSLPYFIKAKDADQESFVLMNIGDLYAHLGDKQKAIDYFEQALQKNKHSNRPSIKAVILRDYANSMLSLGKEEKAVQLYQQSLQQWQATVNKPEEARTAVLLAEYFAKKENRQQAIYYYHYALDTWKKLNEQNEIKTIQAAMDKLEK